MSIMRYEISVNGYKVITTHPHRHNGGLPPCEYEERWKRLRRCPDFVIHYRMDLLVNAGIPVRTVNSFKALHDKVIIVDGKNTQMGSFNFSQAAVQSNSENVLIIWGTSRWYRRICSIGSHAGIKELTGVRRTDLTLSLSH